MTSRKSAGAEFRAEEQRRLQVLAADAGVPPGINVDFDGEKFVRSESKDE